MRLSVLNTKLKVETRICNLKINNIQYKLAKEPQFLVDFRKTFNMPKKPEEIKKNV